MFTKKELFIFAVSLGFIFGIIFIQNGIAFWGSVLIFICVAIMINVSLNCPRFLRENKFRYKLMIRITPKWEELVPYVPKDCEYPEIFWEKIMNDRELVGDKDNALLGKIFQYTAFVDESTGLKQIYSNHDKCFVQEIKESGWVLGYYNDIKEIEKKYGIPKEISLKELEITPYYIGKLTRDENIGYFSNIEDGDFLSRIPTSSIVYHLKRLASVWGTAMVGILEFPKELKKELDEHKVKYLTRNFIDARYEWSGCRISKEFQKHPKKAGFVLSNDEMWWHTFSTKYKEVSLNLKLFHAHDYEDSFSDC